MKKYLSFLIIGIVFGITMTKSEAISWYRIQEMFRFQAFHMYGIIGTAVFLGAISVALIKRLGIRDLRGNPITFNDKQMSIPRYLFGGFIFGLGWALSGACPGPMYTLLGNGMLVFIVVIGSAILGTLAYGALRSKLPH
ncbi:MAG: YeeE/YedE family protein [Bacteroidetes bacterium]|nr:MAG: YeeE/YedE family protein [Bacteroidota bacterium]